MQIYLQFGQKLLKRLKHKDLRKGNKNANGLQQKLQVRFIIIQHYTMKTLLLLLLIGLALSQSTSTSDNFPQTKIIQENTGPIALSNSNTWRQFPLLKSTIELAESKLVHIGYVITMPSPDESHFVTRLVVDGVENDYFRAISGNTIYHTNAISGFVSLSAGSHVIRVDYRTPSSMASSGSEDWTVAALQITY